MTTKSLVTSAMLSKLKKSLSEEFSLFQQKKERTQINTKGLIDLASELIALVSSHQKVLDAIVDNQDTLDSSQIRIYQEIKVILEGMTQLYKTCFQGSISLGVMDQLTKNNSESNKESPPSQIESDLNNTVEQSNLLSREQLDMVVKTFQVQGEPDLTLLERPPMRASLVVNNSIESNDSFERFTQIIEGKGINNELTSFMMTDFNHGEEHVLVASVEKNGGIYHLEMKAPNPIICELDKEDNEIYCLFRNPIDCFKFAQEVTPHLYPH